MAFDFTMTRNAQIDLEDAIGWYESKQVGLGKQFYKCYKETRNKILRNPLMYIQFQGKIRRAPMRKFPFSIFYQVNNELIVILAVFHHSRSLKNLRTNK